MANVRIVRNIGLGDAATSTRTSTVGEPTAAASGQNVFVTGNWFASRSPTMAQALPWSIRSPLYHPPRGDSAATKLSCMNRRVISGSGSSSTCVRTTRTSFASPFPAETVSAPGTGGISARSRSIRRGPICGSTTPTPRSAPTICTSPSTRSTRRASGCARSSLNCRSPRCSPQVPSAINGGRRPPTAPCA